MSLRPWLRPPRHLLVLFLLVTLVPAALLLVFGWRLLKQDRELQLRQVVQAREQLADLAVASLQQNLDAIALRLEDPASIRNAQDSTVVVFTSNSVRGNLLFYPFTMAGKEAPAAAFAGGEQIEIRDQNYARAAAWFVSLTQSKNPAVRSGALIRQARNLRRAGQTQAALEALAEAATIRDVAISGIPGDLFARWMECELLEAAGETSDLRKNASALHADLVAGQWHLDRAAFELHESDAAKWMGGAPNVLSQADLALASAAEWLWTKWIEAPQTAARGREAALLEDRQMTVIWQASGGRLTALIAGPRLRAGAVAVQAPWDSLAGSSTRSGPPRCRRNRTSLDRRSGGLE